MRELLPGLIVILVTGGFAGLLVLGGLVWDWSGTRNWIYEHRGTPPVPEPSPLLLHPVIEDKRARLDGGDSPILLDRVYHRARHVDVEPTEPLELTEPLVMLPAATYRSEGRYEEPTKQ